MPVTADSDQEEVKESDQMSSRAPPSCRSACTTVAYLTGPPPSSGARPSAARKPERRYPLAQPEQPQGVGLSPEAHSQPGAGPWSPLKVTLADAVGSSGASRAVAHATGFTPNCARFTYAQNLRSSVAGLEEASGVGIEEDSRS